jgi:hypothetical protein
METSDLNEFIANRRAFAAETKQAGSGIPANCVQEVMESASNASNKGISQFYTPRAFAEILAKALPAERKTICDLNCGRGDLLFASANRSTKELLGVDIDNVKSSKLDSDRVGLTRVIADITLLYPLLHEIQWQCDLFVLNPPFDLHWYRDRLADLAQSELLTVRDAFGKMDPRVGKDAIDSTVATMMMALDLMSARGEGVLIANNATMERLILNGPYRSLAVHIWQWLTLKGNPMTKIDGHNHGDEFRTAIIYFAKGHVGGGRHQYRRDFDQIDELRTHIEGIDRWNSRSGPRVQTTYEQHSETTSGWMAAREEWNLRTGVRKDGGWNIFLRSDGTIGTNLSVFENRSIKINKEEAKRLFELQDQRPMQLVLQAAQRAQLRKTVEGGIWRVHPDLPGVVAEAIAEYHGVRAPLYSLSPIQSLGYLDEENSIVCHKNLYRVSDGGSKKIPAGALAGLREYIESPSPEAWHRVYSKIVHSGKTAWQLVMLIEPSFPNRIDEDRSEIQADDWTAIPKTETIQQIIEERPCFLAGKTYALRTKGVTVTRTTSKPSLTFGEDDYVMNGVELAIWIKDETGTERLFMEKKHTAKGVELKDDRNDLLVDFYLEDIPAHFEVPHVPDVAECDPAGYDAKLKLMSELEEMLNECPA